MNKLDKIKQYNEAILKIALNNPDKCDWIIYLLQRALKDLIDTNLNTIALKEWL